MKTAAEVNIALVGWHDQGLSKSEIVARLAEACIGWPYVFGAVGEECKKSTREKYYKNYETRNPGEAEQIKKNCQQLSRGLSVCTGCKYYPGGTVRCYDCRGFTRWVLGRVGISLQGAGATSQWNDAGNWAFKGTIDQYTGGVAVFFQKSTTKANTMAHTGFLIDGQIIHCSGTVKKEALYKKITHFAIPKGLEGGYTPVPTKPTLRNGSRGEYVTLLQTKLIQLGYDLAPYGADGTFGNKTMNAVKNFQRDQGLSADGVVGPKTWDALEAGKIQLYTVQIQHISKSVADSIIKTYGGTMTAEEA